MYVSNQIMLSYLALRRRKVHFDSAKNKTKCVGQSIKGRKWD